MADNKLTLANQSAGLEPEIPQVRTLARPVAAPLLAARHETQRNPTLQRLFRQAREEKWPAAKLAEALTPELGKKLEGTSEQMAQVAQYLADEYEQIGDALLIISNVTGKALARITDKDIWQPPPVPRESGGLATPLPRLRPDLEGFLVEWTFNEEREQRVLNDILDRIPQTELLRTEGDRRVLTVTRAGRTTLTQMLSESLPGLLRATRGVGKSFLAHFDVLDAPVETPPGEQLLKCTAVSRVVTPTADMMATNPKFDAFTAISAQIATGWVRDIARTLAVAAKDKAYAQGHVQYDNVTAAEMLGSTLLVGDPALLQYLRQVVWVCLGVEEAPLTGIRPPTGAIVLDPASYECRSREIFDRWEVVAVVQYTLYVNWGHVVSLELLGMPHEVVAELVNR